MNMPVKIDPASIALPTLTLNAQLDADMIRKEYLTEGHVRIENVLSIGAREIFLSFCQNQQWIQLVNAPGGVIEMPYDDWCRMQHSADRQAIEAAMYDRAIDGFQYCYAALRVPAEAERDDASDVMVAIARFMESPDVVSFLERVTGATAPVFGDGQATAYGHGDFLTGHDDDLAGRNRTAACVFGFTPQWRPEWGGLLLFHEMGQANIHGLAPQFNTLDLFAVPRYHSVTQVTRAAPRRRFAVTGWISPS
jgi:Rps23 Pro-64 3,4-dihydroxylase Tpa1-like proline 4-hydroxylase